MSHDWTWQLDKQIPSDTAAAREILEELMEQLTQTGWPEDDRFGIHLAVEEALMNAIKHGNQRDPEKSVHLRCNVAKQFVRISIEDEGEGFDPSQVPDPTLDENLELPTGRGLMLMRSFMSSVKYNELGNCVLMEKTLNDSAVS